MSGNIDGGFGHKPNGGSIEDSVGASSGRGRGAFILYFDRGLKAGTKSST
jgi:hypothetical protein